MIRSVFKNSGLMAGVALALGLAMPASAQSVQGPKVEWNFNMFGPKRAATWGQEELARLMSEATGGNFTMKIHYGEVLGPSREMVDGLKIGAFDMALIATGFIPGKLPVIEGGSLPFLPIPTVYHATALREALVNDPAAKADVKRWDTINIMQVPFAVNEFIGKGAPPLKLTDWKGKRVRALGGDARAMQLLGAVATNMPAPEIYGAVERGMLDGVSSLPYAHAAFKLQEITNWYTTNMGLSSPTSLLLASLKTYDALPPQYKKLLADLAPGVIRKWIDVFKTDDDKAIELFKAKGMTAIAYPEAELDQLRGSVKPIWDDWVAAVNKQGHDGQALLNKMLEAAKNAKAPS